MISAISKTKYRICKECSLSSTIKLSTRSILSLNWSTKMREFSPRLGTRSTWTSPRTRNLQTLAKPYVNCILNLEKIEKSILIVNRENQEIDEEIRIQKDEKNKLNKYNSDLSQDLNKCQAHLQNLMKYNSQIQDELEKYLREDEQIIAIIRKKMAVDVITMRESRKLTDRTYLWS